MKNRKQCRTIGTTMLTYSDKEGTEFEVGVYSTGETAVLVTATGNDPVLVTLTNRAAHELRDFLNRRFPNSTEVQ